MTQLLLGDQVVHEYLRKVVAVSIVLSTPERVPTPPALTEAAKTREIWLAQVRYEDLPQPMPFLDLREALLLLEQGNGPMHQEVGSGKPGDLYPFSQAGLDLILDVAGGSRS